MAIASGRRGSAVATSTIILASLVGMIRWVASPSTPELSQVLSDPAPVVEGSDSTIASEELASTIVHLRIFQEDGRPVPNARWVAYQSANDDSALATGIANSLGKSTFQVPRDTEGFLIETLRSSARAPALTMLVLEGEESVTAEVRVGRGGVIKGRVIDDSGAPVSGLEINLIASRAEVLAKIAEEGVGFPAVVTEEDGSFAVGQVTSLADRFFSRSDLTWKTLRPIELSFGPSVRDSPIYPEPRYFVLGNETVDLGEIVLPRATTYSGRLVDADGVALSGALISTHPRRLRSVDAGSLERPGTALRVRPGTPGFSLLQYEVLTEADGSFVFEQRNPKKALVWTPDGARQRFDLAQPLPGARVDELEWSVNPSQVLELILVDPEGRRVVEPERLYGWGETKPMGIRYKNSWGARFQLESRGGDRRLVELVADADGVFRIPLVFPLVQLERLRVFLTGWLPAVLPGSALQQVDKRLELTIEPFPRVRLAVRIPAQDPRAVSPQRTRFGTSHEWSIVDVDVCKLDPVQRAAAHASQQGSFWARFVPCCGSGSRFSNWAGLQKGKSFVLDMPVQELEEYWVYVSDLPGRPDDLVLEFGPFEPSAARHILPVPPLPEVPTEDVDPREGLARKGLAAFNTGILRGRVVDAESGAPVCGVSVGASEYEMSTCNGDETDSAGRFYRNVRAGESVAVTFTKLGFEDLVSNVSILNSANGFDLGDVRLVRIPTVQGNLIHADGSLVQGSGRLIIPGSRPSWGEVFNDGMFATSANLHAGQSLWLRMRLDRDGRKIDGMQGLRVEEWQSDAINVIEVAPWHDVEIRLRGFEGRRLYSEAIVRVEPVISDDDEPIERSLLMSALASEIVIPSRDGVRTFRVSLGSGRYRVLVERTPFAFVETEFVVRDRPGLQVLECRRE